MTLAQLSMMLKQDLVIIPRQDVGDFTARFSGIEVKDNSTSRTLMGEYGQGKTITSAIENYAQNLSGKFIVCNAGQPNETKLKMDEVTVE